MKVGVLKQIAESNLKLTFCKQQEGVLENHAALHTILALLLLLKLQVNSFHLRVCNRKGS